MSTVTVTPLVEGVVAASADVNATLTSFNDATAAGQLGATNVRQEGIDRRTMSAAGHVVQTQDYGNNTTVATAFAGPTAPSPGAYATVVQTADVTVTLPTKLLIHASCGFHSDPQDTGDPVLLLEFRLEYSDDSGGTWTAMDGTYRPYEMRDVGAYCHVAGAGPEYPGINNSMTWCWREALPTGAPRRYRIAYKSTNSTDIVGPPPGAAFTIDNGVISIEPFGA